MHSECGYSLYFCHFSLPFHQGGGSSVLRRTSRSDRELDRLTQWCLNLRYMSFIGIISRFPLCLSMSKSTLYFAQDLEQTEQIPWDITALWRIQGGKSIKRSKIKEFRFRLFSTLISSVLWAIVVIGPVIYIKEGIDHRDGDHLEFFDCFGPLLAYGLGTVTVIVWCCHVRVLIGPKEHLLLYNKLLVHRPTRKYKLSGAKGTDWAALTNLSRATLSASFQSYFFSFREATCVFIQIDGHIHICVSKGLFATKVC